MGLDMYAARRLYVRQWAHQEPNERYSVHVTKGGKPVPGIKPKNISTIDEDVMDWRKANHIHKWFVDNVQDGTDDCGTYYVPHEKLQSLLEVCGKVLEASELIDGKVNGGTAYDRKHPEGQTAWLPGKVIKDATVAKRFLPTQEGFFFGTYEYDEWYLKDVRDTWEWCKRMVSDHVNGVPGKIYYHSSW